MGAKHPLSLKMKMSPARNIELMYMGVDLKVLFGEMLRIPLGLWGKMWEKLFSTVAILDQQF